MPGGFTLWEVADDTNQAPHPRCLALTSMLLIASLCLRPPLDGGF